ncbi:MAG: twin-arginine translocase TatA/TatE family subunit [Solirubrobacterales bacterium]
MTSTIGFLPNIGPLEIAIVVVVVILVFGPKRLPEVAKSVGQGFRNFKGSALGEDVEKEKLAESNAKVSRKEAEAARAKAGGKDKPES